ncbi:FAD-dependent oxidoreductase [Panacagrimonas sp.]|uniref:FAD-dependent oxidoreductase n=1 Tax=Panacagrimonas sp. TaxID=2480088 RepID=UPI003B516F81
MTPRRWIIAVLLLAAIGAFFALDLGRFLSLEYFQAQRDRIEALQAQRPLAVAGAFFLIYVLATALSLPGAAVLTLIGGALFGLGWGLLLVSFASTFGASLAFVISRSLLRDHIQSRFSRQLKGINEGFARDGGFYLFTLRLVPAVPFFVVNLVMGLTPIKLRTFYWVSQLGMLPGTLVYVNAGTELGDLTSLRDVASPTLIGAFVLLGLFPYLARALVQGVRGRRVYAGLVKPRRFDRNLIVIGAGSAGLVASFIAAAVKAKVTLIEKHRMGGDCLNTGCVPSKALLRAAKLVSHIDRASEFGIQAGMPKVDFAAVMGRVRKVVAEIEPHDSVERYRGLGVECLQGEARLIDPWTVAVGGRTLSARNIVIATGAEPFVPPLPGLAEAGYLTSDTLWELDELPCKLVVLGGGPIGCELAQAFVRLGAQVTQVEMAPRLLMREDPEVSALVADRFVAEGVDLRLQTKALRVIENHSGKFLVCEHGGREDAIAFDRILVAVGRAARLEGYGLEELGMSSGKTLEVNEFLQTRFPNVYACGDVAGPYQFTHTAAHMAWYATVNSLFGPLLALRGGPFKVDYSVIPWATFTEPEVARVGLNETEARERGVEYEVTRYPLEDLDRAIADGEAHGLVKVLTEPGRDRILGVTIVGEHAGDLIAEFVLAMRHRLGLNKILGTIHIYPTLAEANKFAAGAWKQAHKPERLLRWVARFHAWRRG